MNEKEYRLENLPEPLLDLDAGSNDSWVGVAGKEQKQVLLFDGRAVKIPQVCRFPIVRAIGNGRAIVVDTRIEKAKQVNAWVVDTDGNVKTSFCVGDGVQDVLASEKWIVVTYFDEGVFSDIEPGPEGLVVFDTSGKFKFGYQSHFGKKAVDIADCYCACWVGPHQIMFLPYTEFPLVRLDLETFTQEIYATPKELHGSRGLTVLGDRVFCHGPYDQRDIREWRVGNQKAACVGQYTARLRGLGEGRFLALGQAGYTIVSLTDHGTP